MSISGKGLLLVVSGPAGSGKGTVLKCLMEKNDDFVYSVSATTRAPRPGEVNGVKFMRKFYTYYIQGIKNASKYREVLVRIDSADELLRTLDEILDIYYSNRG